MPVTQSWPWGNQTIDKYVLHETFAKCFSNFMEMELFWTSAQRGSYEFAVIVLLLPIFLKDMSQSRGHNSKEKVVQDIFRKFLFLQF